MNHSLILHRPVCLLIYAYLRLCRRIYTYVKNGIVTMAVDVTRKPQARKGSMTKLATTNPATLAAIVVVATAVAFTARAEVLRPIRAKSLHLGEMDGVAYYTVQDHGYRVVATLASQGGTPVRCESTLLPGQKVVMSIPGSAGAKTQTQTVEFLRQGVPTGGDETGADRVMRTSASATVGGGRRITILDRSRRSPISDERYSLLRYGSS
jgi:hypothetical protein